MQVMRLTYCDLLCALVSGFLLDAYQVRIASIFPCEHCTNTKYRLLIPLCTQVSCYYWETVEVRVKKITINSRSCAFCAVWHQLTTLFCTPDVSQANHDLYSGEILLPSKLCQNLCLQHRSTRRKTTFCGFTLGGLKLLVALQVVAFDGFAPQIVGSLLTTFAFILLHLQVLLHHSKQSSPMV